MLNPGLVLALALPAFAWATLQMVYFWPRMPERMASHFGVAPTTLSFLDGAMTNPHVLILGGTTEARALGERLSARGGIAVTLSLAGRTAKPLPQAGSVRSAGCQRISRSLSAALSTTVAVVAPQYCG